MVPEAVVGPGGGSSCSATAHSPTPGPSAMREAVSSAVPGGTMVGARGASELTSHGRRGPHHHQGQQAGYGSRSSRAGSVESNGAAAGGQMPPWGDFMGLGGWD